MPNRPKGWIPIIIIIIKLETLCCMKNTLHRSVSVITRKRNLTPILHTCHQTGLMVTDFNPSLGWCCRWNLQNVSECVCHESWPCECIVPVTLNWRGGSLITLWKIMTRNHCVECYGGSSIRLDELESIMISIFAGNGTLMLRESDCSKYLNAVKSQIGLK